MHYNRVTSPTCSFVLMTDVAANTDANGKWQHKEEDKINEHYKSSPSNIFSILFCGLKIPFHIIISSKVTKCATVYS